MSLLRVGSTEVPVKGGAAFGIFVRSERVHLHTGQWQAEPMVGVRYDFEVVVDERCGEDGELAPAASVTSLFEDGFALGIPLGRELVLERDRGHWEAVLGNDSWSLEGNRIVLDDFDGKTARVTWTAVVGNEREPRPFLFHGGARFEGILVWADDSADLDRAIADTWGPGVLSLLTRTNVRVDQQVSPPRWSAHYDFSDGLARGAGGGAGAPRIDPVEGSRPG